MRKPIDCCRMAHGHPIVFSFSTDQSVAHVHRLPLFVWPRYFYSTAYNQLFASIQAAQIRRRLRGRARGPAFRWGAPHCSRAHRCCGLRLALHYARMRLS